MNKMQNKIKTYLGFAIRSGKIIYGFDNLKTSKKTIELVLISAEQNDKVTNKVIHLCEQSGWKCHKLGVNLSDYIDRNIKILALTDKSLSDAILNELQNIPLEV